MASLSLPSYLSARNNNRLQVSAGFLNISHQNLAFSSSVSSSSLSLHCPVLSSPTPTNTLQGEIVAGNFFRFPLKQRPRSLRHLRKVMKVKRYKDGGKSHKNKPFDSVKAESICNRAVETLRKQNTSAVVMEDFDDYNVLKKLIIKNVWVPDFIIYYDTDKSFMDALQLKTNKLGNELRRETLKVMKKH